MGYVLYKNFLEATRIGRTGMSQPQSPGRRRGSKKNRRSEDTGLRQIPWRRVVNPYRPVDIVSADEVEAIHQASLTILEEIGIDFHLAEARDLLAAAGAKVEPGGMRVRMDRHFVEEMVASAPSEFTLHARNPERDLVIGGNHVVFSTVSSAPNASDLENGRRPGTQADFRNFVRLAQSLNVVHFNGGYPVEAQDIPPEVRHLECLRDFVALSDKAFDVYSLSRAHILDAIEIARIGRGISAGQMEREPTCHTVVNTSSPLRIDGAMLWGVIEMARHNQAVCVTPFTLAGAMAPVTIAGALAQQNAEALAGIVLAQVVRPGAPVIYGGFTSNVDMRTGSPTFGTPEHVRATQVGGQLARRHGIPYRSSNVNTANCVDAQAVYESQMSLWGAVMGHANLIMHGAGWLEAGLCASFEKFIIDAEMLQLMAEYLIPVEVNDDTLALDAIREVGPGGHFFGAAHTRARYENAFYQPLISDWRIYETWNQAGALTATERAHGLYKRLLAEYQPPPLDPAIREELDAFVAKRTEEGGAPSY